MVIELFALCDGAYNYNGKLTIVGTLADISVSSIPAKINIGMALKIRLEPNEIIGDNLSIQFYDPDNNKVPVDVNVSLDSKSVDDISYISVAANMQGLPIEKCGRYFVRMVVDGNTVSEYTFKVEQKA